MLLMGRKPTSAKRGNDPGARLRVKRHYAATGIDELGFAAVMPFTAEAGRVARFLDEQRRRMRPPDCLRDGCHSAVSDCHYPLSRHVVSETGDVAQTPGRSDTIKDCATCKVQVRTLSAPR